jgi:hypothetical protein
MRVLTFTAVLQHGRLELQPGFVMEGEPSREKGELTVDVLGRGRRPLATTVLPLHKPCGHAGGDTAQAAVGLVAFPKGATALRVSHRGRVLLEQTEPRGDLKIDVEWPASLSGAETVKWRRASAGSCVASLGYSNDGGETWTPLALPGPEEAIKVDARALPGGQQCLLELIVTDGFHSQRIRSNTYEVERKGWLLWILSPVAGSALPADRPVLLAAQGYHLEERRAGFDIDWESSAGGLGTGARVLATLEPGEHTITARMHGLTARVAVSVA